MDKKQLQTFLSFICIFAAIVMTFISLFLPPQGEIHSSVLVLTGEVLVFVGALAGIDAVASNNIAKINEMIKDVKKDGK